jgi:hypothetical protein
MRRLGLVVPVVVGLLALPGCETVLAVTGITPAAGAVIGGTSVTITGTKLDTAETVLFGDAEASFEVVSATSIEAVAPPGEAGTVPVTVSGAGESTAADPAPSFTYLPEAEPGPDTVVVDPGDVVAAEQPEDGSGGGTLTLDGDAPAPAVGDIVSSADGQGLLGRVVDVGDQGSETVVETEPVALAEAFPTGAFDTDVTVDGGALAPPGPTLSAGRASGSASSGSAQAASATTLQCDDDVTLEGSASLDDIDLDLNIHAAWGPLVTDELTVTGTVTATSTVALEGELSGDCWITIAGPVALPPVPVVPGVLVLTPKLRGKLKLDAHVDVAELSATVTAKGTVGVAWDEVRGLRPVVDVTPPDVSLDGGSLLGRGFTGEGRVALGGEVAFLLNGLLGPSVFVGPSLKVSAELSRNPWLTVSAGLLVDAELKIDVWFVELKWQLVEHTFFERVIFRAPAAWPGPRLSGDRPPGGRLDQPYQWTPATSGGTAPLTWSIAAGGLPPGLALSPQGGVTGTPTASGERSATLQVVDAQGRAARERLTFRIAGIEIADGLPAAALNEPYTAQMVALGGRAPYSWAVASGSLPSGITLDASGALAGEPSQARVSSSDIRVTDAAGRSVTKTVRISVGVPQPEIIPLATDGWLSAATLADGTLVIPVNEADQDEDRNGDGDLTDIVMALRSPDGSVRNTATPLQWDPDWPLPRALPGGGMVAVSRGDSYVTSSPLSVVWLDPTNDVHLIDSWCLPEVLADGTFTACTPAGDGSVELREVSPTGGPGAPVFRWSGAPALEQVCPTLGDAFSCLVVPLEGGGYAFAAPADSGSDPSSPDTPYVWWVRHPGRQPVATNLLATGTAVPTADGSLLVWSPYSWRSPLGEWRHVAPDLTISTLGIVEPASTAATTQHWGVGTDTTGAAVIALSERGDPSNAADDIDRNDDGDADDYPGFLIGADGSVQPLPWELWWNGARGLDRGGFVLPVANDPALGQDGYGSVVIDPSGRLIAALPTGVIDAGGDAVGGRLRESDVGRDLTGDGDTRDETAVLYPPPYAPVYSGVPASDSGMLGRVDGSLSFGAVEPPGRDLNGDGVGGSRVLAQLYPDGDAAFFPLGAANGPSLPNGGSIGYTFETSVDLNGDGDVSRDDNVLHLMDRAGRTTNIGMTGAPLSVGPRANCAPPCETPTWTLNVIQAALVTGDDKAVAITREWGDGEDLNGDGDTEDDIMVLVSV